MLGVPLIAASTPAPTWWAHDSACAWTAGWLTVRGRTFLGQREVLSRAEWSGQLHWQDRNSIKRSGHRPDLVALHDSSRFAIEVELAGKSRARLDAILKLHDHWILGGDTGGVIYICGDEEGRRRVERSANRVAPFGRKLRLELLDTIKEQTIAAREASLSGCAAEASAAPAPMLGGHGGSLVVMAADKRKPKSKGKARVANKTRGAAKDPGPPYHALWHPAADAEREASWPPEEKVAMFHAVQKLEAAGPRLGSPHSSAVQGDAGRGLRELRPRAGRSRWRPIYRRVSPSTFVILASRTGSADRLPRLRRRCQASSRAIQTART